MWAVHTGSRSSYSAIFSSAAVSSPIFTPVEKIAE
jgi:hypothetical protein